MDFRSNFASPILYCSPKIYLSEIVISNVMSNLCMKQYAKPKQLQRKDSSVGNSLVKIAKETPWTALSSLLPCWAFSSSLTCLKSRPLGVIPSLSLPYHLSWNPHWHTWLFKRMSVKPQCPTIYHPRPYHINHEHPDALYHVTSHFHSKPTDILGPAQQTQPL